MMILTFLVIMVSSMRNEALHCQVGFEMTSAMTAYSFWNSTECPEQATVCLRVESEAILYGFMEGRVIAGMCAVPSNCTQETCNRAIATRVDENGGSSYEVRNCSVVCCYEDNCNANNITEIRNISPTSPISYTPPIFPTVPFESTTTTTVTAGGPDIIPTAPIKNNMGCRTGYNVSSSIVNLDVWNVSQCIGAQNMCIKANANVMALNIFEVNVTAGMCITEEQCYDLSCDKIAELFLSADSSISRQLQGVTFDILNCSAVCCSGYNCNRFTVAEIEAGEHIKQPAQTTTPATTTKPEDNKMKATPSKLENATAGVALNVGHFSLVSSMALLLASIMLFT